MIEVNAIFPSVVPRSYLDQLGEGACSYYDLGPNLIVMLSMDMGSALRNVSPSELKEAEITDDEAWAKAMGNLGEELSTCRLKVGVGEFEDGGKALIMDGHWLASAAIFHHGFYQWFSEQLETKKLCALVSERDSAVIFAEDCSPLVREKVEFFISKVELDSRKPFGRNFFRLEADGPTYVD